MATDKWLWATLCWTAILHLGLGVKSVSADISSNDNKQGSSLFEMGLTELLSMRVVTAASGFEQNVEEAPASVTVIEAEEWQAMGATELFEAIAHVPGLHITKVQTAATNNRPMIRGISGTFGQQILILVDGLPFRHIRDGGTLWGQRIPLNAFKRIEVIRSPGSAIYGADAVGGIINLVSYQPGDMPGTVALRGGDFGAAEFEWRHAQRWQDSALQWAFSAQTADGDPQQRVSADLQTQLDAMTGTQVSRAPGPLNEHYTIYTLRAQWQVQQWQVDYLNWHNAGSGTGAGVAQVLDPDGDIRQTAQTLTLSYDLSEHVRGDMSLRGGWHNIRSRLWSRLFPAGSQIPVAADGNIDFANSNRLVTFTDGVIGVPGNNDRTLSLQLDHVFEPWPGHRLRWALGIEHTQTRAREAKNFGPGVLDDQITLVGSELTDVTGTEYIYLPDKQRRNRYVAVQNQWDINDRLRGTLGARYDDYSDVGSTLNPRVGLVWKVLDPLTVKAFMGTAFRAPSFADLYTQNNPAGTGNPDLESETIRTLDGGFSATYSFSERLQMDLNLFRYHADNIITFVPVEGVQTAQNSGELKVRGVEYQLQWQLGRRSRLEFNYTYMDDYQRRLIDNSAAPRQIANGVWHVYHRGWHWYTGVKWVADRRRDEGDTRAAIDDNLGVDTHLQRSFGAWRLGASVRNVFDADLREPSNGFIADDYPLPGRQWRLEAVYAY